MRKYVLTQDDCAQNKNICHDKARPRICVITSPRPKASIAPISNLMGILSNLANYLCLITGNEGKVVCDEFSDINCYSLKHNTRSFFLTKIAGSIFLQMRISYMLILLRKKVDVLVFFMAERLCLPVLIGKLLRKRVILNLAAHCPTVTRNDPDFIVRAAARLELLNYAIADKIILYSPNLIKEWDLEQYKNKTLIASRHYLNFDKFTNQKSLQERDPYVGYAGRLSEEKGVLNLIQAGPGILKNQVDMKLLIGGDGYLQQSIEDFLSEVEWADMVQLLGWIPHDELPDFLNQLKLLVLPSYTEGLPNVMLEAMACGTPVLATPVGAVPDIIKDGLTGFIMEDNSPNCIAKNIARAFKHPDLQQIANNARDLVERQFTYEAAMKQYNNLFNDLQSEN